MKDVKPISFYRRYGKRHYHSKMEEAEAFENYLKSLEGVHYWKFVTGQFDNHILFRWAIDKELVLHKTK